MQKMHCKNRLQDERGFALIVVTLIVATIVTFAMGFTINYLVEVPAVNNTMRDAQSFYLSETALGFLPVKLANQNFNDMTAPFLVPSTTIDGIDSATDVWRTTGSDIFNIADPNLVRGDFSLSFSNDNRWVRAQGRLYYEQQQDSAVVQLTEERNIAARIPWLSENFEYPLFLGDLWNNGDIIFSFGSNPTPGLDVIVGGRNAANAYVEGQISMAAPFSPINPMVALPRTKTPLLLDQMDYGISNYTHYVDASTAGNPDFDGVLEINPADWRQYIWENVSGHTSKVDAFFGGPDPRNPQPGAFQGEIYDLNVGTDRVYYVDGNVWFMNPYANQIRIEGRATIIARRNIFIYNDLIYQNATQDMLVLIALGENYTRGSQTSPSRPRRYGNIFVSDPTIDCYFPQANRVTTINAFLYAARDFFYNIDWFEFFTHDPPRIRFSDKPDYAPGSNPVAANAIPFSGLTILGGLTVQGLGANYSDDNQGRVRVPPYIRRDIYVWRDAAGNNNYSSTFFDESVPMWYGLEDTSFDDVAAHNQDWTNWTPLDGTTVLMNTFDDPPTPLPPDSWSDPALVADFPNNMPFADDWVFDRALSSTLLNYCKKQDDPTACLLAGAPLLYKSYSQTIGRWVDYKGNSGIGDVPPPIIHIPLVIIYDSRIAGLDQPPGLPEDFSAPGSIPSIHVKDWQELPRSAGSWGEQP